MKLSRIQLGFIGLYLATVILWVALRLSGSHGGTGGYWYSFVFGLVPLLGGLVGIRQAKIWGWLSSAMGRAVFYTSLGLLLWGAGEMVWSYYNFFGGEAAPYPSLADIGFGPSIFFWIVGVLNLSRASGAKYGWRKPLAKVGVVGAMAILLIASYYLLVVEARGGVVTDGGGTLKVILDIAYPLGDLLALLVAVVIYALSRRYLGGQYRRPTLTVLLGLAAMYFGDFVFSYTTTTGSYYNGDWGDLLLATGLALITVGTLGLAVRPRALAGKSS